MKRTQSALVVASAALLAVGIRWGNVSVGSAAAAGEEQSGFAARAAIPAALEKRVALKGGETVEISARIVSPSRLPDNGRVRVTWTLTEADDAAAVPRRPGEGTSSGRPLDAEGIYTAPTANWSKLLHALDGDVYLVYRAPVGGTYELRIAPEEGPVDLFGGERWREAGKVAQSAAIPSAVAWPKGVQVEVEARVAAIDVSPPPGLDFFIEAEPNDTPEQAQPLPLKETTDDYTLHVLGGSDDIEYFDNGRVGSSGDDWFRLEFLGPEPRLLTACLSIPDQMLAARIRCYAVEQGQAAVAPGELLPITKEYEEGKNENERVHQQQEQHRIAINRTLQPGHVYFLRVEANAPGYELELRVVRPAPFDDPRQAVRHALYDHIGQVDSWLANRPRGASVERRIRDTGNLLGTACMSCHTQSGVWGPAIPFEHGYRPQNVQLFRDLVNICYQSMRPTNELIDAANNTSLAPLDLGDGPAGTRVAGHAVVSLERFQPPRKLQSMQAIRAANFILQSADPGGINAAGPGANVGKSVVYNYAGEVLAEAWRATGGAGLNPPSAGEPKYFRAMEEKARKLLEVDPKYADDMAHRVEFLRRFFPQNYVEAAAEVAAVEREQPQRANRVPYETKPTSADEARTLWEQIEKQVDDDLARLRAIQNEDGSWGFNPGTPDKEGKTWKVVGDNKAEPSPTALAIIAFQAAGVGVDDPAVARGIRALLKMQHPTGFWKRDSQTGFVSTSYAMHALSRYFPVEPPTFTREQFAAKPGETLVETVGRVRELSITGDPQLAPLMVEAAGHDSPLVRYYAMIGLGTLHCDEGVAPLVRGLGDRARMVREAAHWGLRQTLIDDRGWEETLAALKSADDYVREEAMKALVMRVDGVMPGMSLPWERLTAALDHGLNGDAHPAVRAWAARGAWNWWIWNPPVRGEINRAWVKLLSREEANRLVENAVRYQSHALFVANGHKANGSGTHQYKELGELFTALQAAMERAASDDPEVEKRLARRMVAVAATFYNTSGGDGGPGQMGYSTGNAGKVFGDAVLTYFKRFNTDQQPAEDTTLLQIALEGAANIPHRDLQQRLIDYSLNGPEELRSIAANSISDPRSAQLVAVPELIEPLMKQVHRGAAEPERRPQLSDPLIKLFARVKFVIPDTAEQQRQVFDLFIPQFGEFHSAEAIKAIADPARRGALEKQMESEWYLATGLGDALGSNPDLRLDTTLDYFPESFENALAARFWLPSVAWILTYKTMLPEVQVEAGKLPPIDPYEERRTRALRLFLDQLQEKADPRTRELAVKMAQETSLRRNPEVLNALDALLKFDKREPVVKMAKNVLSTGRDNFLKELADAVKQESPRRFGDDGDGKPKIPEQFIDDFAYFRDYVTPEMNRVLRNDQRSCFACHGVPGRVPPLTLHRPDDAGYLPVAKLLENYRLLQDRVDFGDVEKSKLLRKPLNVQTGQEDGHQGGRRYQPTDPGYQILRSWALNQVTQREKLGAVALGGGER